MLPKLCENILCNPQEAPKVSERRPSPRLWDPSHDFQGRLPLPRVATSKQRWKGFGLPPFCQTLKSLKPHQATQARGNASTQSHSCPKGHTRGLRCGTPQHRCGGAAAAGQSAIGSSWPRVGGNRIFLLRSWVSNRATQAICGLVNRTLVQRQRPS